MSSAIERHWPARIKCLGAGTRCHDSQANGMVPYGKQQMLSRFARWRSLSCKPADLTTLREKALHPKAWQGFAG